MKQHHLGAKASNNSISFQSMSKVFPFLAQYEAILPKFGKNAVKVQKLAWLCQILNYQHQNLVNVNVPTKQSVRKSKQ